MIEDLWVRSELADRINQEVLAYVDVQQIANQAVDAVAAPGWRPAAGGSSARPAGPLADGSPASFTSGPGNWRARSSPRRQSLWVPRTLSGHAKCTYSCTRPPSRSRRSGRTVVPDDGGVRAGAELTTTRTANNVADLPPQPSIGWSDLHGPGGPPVDG